MTLNADGSFTYTPAAGFSAADRFVYRAVDAAGLSSNDATVSLAVRPVATNDTYGAAFGAPISATAAGGLLANDRGTGLTVDAITNPAHGTVTVGADGAFTYTPDASFTGLDTFTYTLTPGGDLATVSVTVTCVDDFPVAVDDSATFTEDDPATVIDVFANDTDVDGGPIAVDSVTQPANGTAAITGGGTGLTYQPDLNYCNTQTGGTPDTFDYTLTPGTATATVSVTVTTS